jgi:phosphoribosylaminoimidazole-succinocarboxamide synthase
MSDLPPYLTHTIGEIDLPFLPNHYRGKVRDSYDLPDGRRIMVASDRLSAFDINLTTIPLKGQVLTQIARYWFDSTRDICPNHVIAYPDPNVVVCRKLKIMPVEIVVRNYLAGTTGTALWTMYNAGKRDMYGITFPDGLRKNQKLDHVIITPTTKAMDGEHDDPLSPDDIISRGLLTTAQWEKVSTYALALFERGKKMAAERGLMLVDTKYEFGFDDTGAIILADEIHTPDSSRYWFTDTYQTKFEAGEMPQSFDKDFIRNWVVARCDPYKDKVPAIPDDVRLKMAAVYIEAYETITGRQFALPNSNLPAMNRIHNALQEFR